MTARIARDNAPGLWQTAGMMRPILPSALLAAALLAAPLAAQTAPETSGDGEISGGLDLLGQGAQALLRGLMQEIDPALRSLQEGVEGLGPMFTTLTGLIGDVRHYETPERLPNGDILIRRKPGAPPPAPLTPEALPAPPPAGAIDL